MPEFVCSNLNTFSGSCYLTNKSCACALPDREGSDRQAFFQHTGGAHNCPGFNRVKDADIWFK